MKVSEQLHKDFTPEDKKKIYEIQDCEIKILKAFDKICRTHSLDYSLGGGTLLGAARHQDLIPWDDDIDIHMTDVNYARFLDIVKEELPEEFEFIDYSEHDRYFCDFISRIYYKNSHAVNSHSNDAGRSNFANDPRMNRIFIEVYRMNETRLKNVKRQIFDIKAIYGMAMAHRFVKKENIYTPVQKLQIALLGAAGKCLSLKQIYNLYEKTANRFAPGDGDCYFNPSAPLPVQEKNVIKKEVFSEYKRIPFRNDEFMVVADYETELELLYGDWKSLPDEKDRHPGHYILKHTFIDV